MESRIIFGARLGAAVVVKIPQHVLPPRSFGRLCWPLAIHRCYATSNTLAGTTKTSSRKQVTIGNDDGRIPWGQLSVGEKAARTTQQTFNFGIILAGAVGLVGPRFISLCVSLIQIRLLLATISTSMSSPPTVKLDTSTERLTGSERTLVHSICLGLVKKSAHLVNPQRASGPGTDPSRKEGHHACTICTIPSAYDWGLARVPTQTELGSSIFKCTSMYSKKFLHDQYLYK